VSGFRSIGNGKIANFVQVYFGHALWRDMEGKALTIEDDRELAKHCPRPGSACARD
jgi:hypothetical protein